MRGSGRYILKDRIPVACDDLLTWARWFEGAERVVHQENVGELFVSTVFLGLDHQFVGGPPLLFETMVFGKAGAGDDIYQARCSTWEQAETQHAEAVEWVRRKAQ